jgi:predicted nucleic acid-binding protein
MPAYLLDTSVISAFAPGKPPVPTDVGEWLISRTHELFLPSVAIAEIEQGICKLRRNGGIRRAELLSLWLDGLVRDYGSHVLPLDAAVARLAGQLGDQALADGLHPGFADVAIAAIARQGQLAILTRNVRHFAALGVAHFDPFNASGRP